MGYGIVLWLDHRGMDELGDAELGSALAGCVGAATYPSGGLDEAVCGPWQRAGAWHSNEAAELVADDTGVHRGEALGGAWDRTWTMGEMADRHRAAASDRSGRALRALAGELRTAPGAVASVWWLYADCVEALGAEDPAEVGRRVREAVAERVGGSVRIGNWANALNCAGRVTGQSVALYWEGNRLWDRAGAQSAAGASA